MKKIPTLFERLYDNNGRIIDITDTVKPGFEWVLSGDGVATVKIDGSCCAIINGVYYKRYDAKKGKTPPAGALPCTPEPDPITGHWPHWVKVDDTEKADKWFIEAYRNWFRMLPGGITAPGNDGTYEAIGKHFNGNPYQMEFDVLLPHGRVFWKDGEPQCKIKRSDFGYKWP